jgi:polyisoprenoid-binding protein YceI
MLRPNRGLALVALLFATTLVVAANAAWTLIDTPTVEFLAVATAGLKITGQSEDLAGSEAGGKLTMTAGLTDLKTGIGLRDGHLRRYLETEKFPNATLVVERSALKIPDDDEIVTAHSSGEFTIHGVTKSTPFEYQAKRLGSDYLVQGKLKVNLADFKIEQPCFLNVCVDNDVKVKVKFKLRDQ